MIPKVYKEVIDLGDGREITIETGKLAKQAHGSVVVQMGKTMLLCTVVSNYEPSDVDFMPLTVDYREKFSAAGIDCLTTGTKALWPGAGIFDYMNLRTNGYDFHMDLANGKVEWTDDRVKATFAEWAKIQPFITKNHAALDWQDAAALLVQGKAANYVMGNFAVGVFNPRYSPNWPWKGAAGPDRVDVAVR